MIQEYTTYRVLGLFFDHPMRHFQLREICRALELGMPSVSNHIRKLKEQGFIIKEKQGVYESYISSRSELFKMYKRMDIVLRLHKSGLVDFLADEFVPDAIVLFGSASRGEDVEESDIDLFLLARERDIDLKRFEEQLKRKVTLHFEAKASDVPKELLNNIINGTVLYGYLKVL